MWHNGLVVIWNMECDWSVACQILMYSHVFEKAYWTNYKFYFEYNKVETYVPVMSVSMFF